MAGIYIHIPFCATRCHYCDFFSTTSIAYEDDFTKSLLIEIENHKSYLAEEIETIYFGGGTPSFISSKNLQVILDKIYKTLNISVNPEITLEANPDDLNIDKIAALKQIGFNRLSIGIQSFHDDELELMNRRHNAKEAIISVQNAQKEGFNNISVDLIYGIPGQDLLKFDFSIEQALKLNVQHISAYHLTYEPGTLFHQKLGKKQFQAVSEDVSLDLFQHLRKKLQANDFLHYEISNFAKSKLYSKHNTNYWKNKPYLGLGPSAHSFDGNMRKWNVSNMKQYMNGLNNGESVHEEEILTAIQKLNEYIMVSLRTMWGIDLNYIETNYDSNYVEKLTEKAQKQIQKNNLEIQENCLKLTEKGIFIADFIISELFFE
jgi:putative oxygen-independent coproporphyrinogen III oxidase